MGCYYGSEDICQYRLLVMDTDGEEVRIVFVGPKA